MINLYSLLPTELSNLLQTKYNIPKYRAMQVFNWLYKNVNSFAAMSNLPKDLREKLTSDFTFPKMEILERQKSYDGAQKFLLKCPFDENLLEVVLMTYKFGLSVCISTQIGCAMHCSFCASGKHGLIRNLNAGEMIQEILSIQKEIDQRISNVVLMGMGEPLDNFDEIIKFLQIVHHPKGLNLGYRHITLSTCGIIPKIRKLADYEFPITLAISLHAPNDELRKKMMPITRKYPLHELIQACKYYQERTKRRITFEYAMIAGVNDTPLHARQLANLIQPIMSHVNLIPLNPTDTINQGSAKKIIQRFAEILDEKRVNWTIRREMGSEIDAACGQLRNRIIEG